MNRIVVLGGAESGVGAAVLAKVKGYDTFLSDNGCISQPYLDRLQAYGIEYEMGGHSLPKILNADLIIKSPGIPDNVPVMVKIREKGIPVISEIEFAGRYDRAITYYSWAWKLEPNRDDIPVDLVISAEEYQ